MASIVANYDGPLYIVVAKTFYNRSLIQNFSFSLPAEYYSAHFPFYPFLIRLFSPLFGYPYSMLFISILSSIFACLFFYKLVTHFMKNENDALFLTFFFSIFPARFLIVKSIGSPEPLFVGAIIASLYYLINKKYFLSAIFGVVAQITKSPAIILFIAYLPIILQPLTAFISTTTHSKDRVKEFVKFLPLFAIPISLFAIFLIYYFKTGDFFSYFHSGDNIHLFFPPFQIFNYSQPWVGTYWLEEIIFIYMIEAMGVIKLFKQKLYPLAYFTSIFFVTTLFISHRDLLRYSLPIIPFIIIAFSDTITKKEFRIVLALLIIPIYLFSLAFIANNIMPIPDWAPLL